MIVSAIEKAMLLLKVALAFYCYERAAVSGREK